MYKEFKNRTAQGQLVPTNKEWREIQIATVTDPTDAVRNRLGADQVMVNHPRCQESRDGNAISRSVSVRENDDPISAFKNGTCCFVANVVEVAKIAFYAFIFREC